MLLEICSGSLQSAINAQAGGAHRIELCCNLEQGGLTPSPATIQLARAKLNIDIFVLIRPRIGDFNYSEIELEQMYADIEFCKKVGVDGVVFGVLNAQNEVAVDKNKYLLKAAEGLPTTFHRAFDCLDNPMKGLAEVSRLGFDRILTSGLAVTAIEGQNLLKTLIAQAPTEVTILPGSGLNSSNVSAFLQHTKAQEIHASAKRVISPATKSLFAAPYFETDVGEVRRLRGVLEELRDSRSTIEKLPPLTNR